MLNLLITSFPGLGLPSTVVVPVEHSSSVASALHQVSQRIGADRLSLCTLSTLSNKTPAPSDAAYIADLLQSPHDEFLTLRLSVPVKGGKGGFGSQLRADGGRMSSRKKKSGVEENASSRNLDGRRLRTVTEAKNLAQYMISKPEADRKAKDERRKRLESIVESAERKQEQLKTGSHVHLDGSWIEEKDRQREHLREAMIQKAEEADAGSEGGPSAGGQPGTSSDKGTAPKRETAPKVYGWDDDLDEFMSSSDEEGASTPPSEASTASKGKSPA